MKALRLTAWGHDLEICEVSEPDPGPGEVVVRIGGSGACHSDIHLFDDYVEGLMPFDPPFTVGHENAGWVHAVGPGVTGLDIGEAVAVYGAWGCGRCRTCLSGAENYCEGQGAVGAVGGGIGFDGGMAEFMLVPHRRWVVPLGDLDPVLAAPLTDAGLTPYHAIKRSLGVLVPGSTAVVIGAGGLGHMAIQILRALTPANVIVVDRDQDTLDRAMTLGATHAVMANDDAATEILGMTGGNGAEMSLDLVGVDQTMALGAAVTRTRGQLTIVGLGMGSLPVNFFSMGRGVSMSTGYWGTLPELVEVIALAESGRIRPSVQRFALEEAADAYDMMRAGTLEGRAVVVPDSR